MFGYSASCLSQDQCLVEAVCLSDDVNSGVKFKELPESAAIRRKRTLIVSSLQALLTLEDGAVTMTLLD